MKQKIVLGLISVLIASILCTCKSEVEVNAPYQDIYVVYGILHASDSVQYISVNKAFLVNQDAIEYAKSYDPSVKNLKVVLIGNGKTYTATEINNVPLQGEGAFYPFATLYKIATSGANALVSGKKYDLTIGNFDNDSLQLKAYTYIPLASVITFPTYLITANNEKQLQEADLEDPFNFNWTAKRGIGAPYSFEVYAFLHYEKNGIPDTATYKSRLILNGATQNCPTGSMCYNARPKEILHAFRKNLDDETAIYTYKDSPKSGTFDELPKSLKFEVTSIDTFLTKYLRANTPYATDFNTIRPQYTNLTGNKAVYGVFGATHTAEIYTLMNGCSAALLTLNNTHWVETSTDCNW